MSDVNASDEERTWINRVTSEIVFQPLHLDTGAPLHEERVIAVREEPSLHLELYQRDITDGMRSPWKFPVLVVSKSFQEVVKITRKLENTMRTVFGLGFHSFAVKDVDHDALCLTLFNEVRQPGAHAPNCTAMSATGILRRGIRHLEAHSTLAAGRKNGRLCFEMSCEVLFL